MSGVSRNSLQGARSQGEGEEGAKSGREPLNLGCKGKETQSRRASGCDQWSMLPEEHTSKVSSYAGGPPPSSSLPT